ncbi:unnamed protein product [Amoebophrya sp. A120]|nr:unnamed protein product [Amoebophrya sp. A120]|eukprot:GSA120T00014686001.1
MTSLDSIEAYLPQEAFGCIIGQGGSRMSEIRQSFDGIKIQTDREAARNGFRLLKIHGEWVQMWCAFCEVIKSLHLDEKFAQKNPNLVNRLTVQLKIPIKIAGGLIGKGGANLNGWRAEWPKCQFDVKNDESDRVYRYFYLVGSSIELQEAAVSIADVLEQCLINLQAKEGGAGLAQQRSVSVNNNAQQGARANNNPTQRNVASKANNPGNAANKQTQKRPDNQNITFDDVVKLDSNPEEDFLRELSGAGASTTNFPDLNNPFAPANNPFAMGGGGTANNGSSNVVIDEIIGTENNNNNPGAPTQQVLTSTNSQKRRRVDGNQTIQQTQSKIHQEHSERSATELECVCTLQVKENTMGKIIGRNGEEINKIRQSSNCEITTDRKGDRKDNMREVQIRGASTNVATAILMITTLTNRM